MPSFENDPVPTIVTHETLTVQKALQLRDLAIGLASACDLSGAVSIFNSLRWELCSQLTDDHADPGTIDIARGKIWTVLNSGRSSSLQSERIREKGYDRADFMGRMGSLFGGGVPLFVDEERRRFIGAMAFSGGSWQEDQDLCVNAVNSSKLFTDVQSSDALFARLNPPHTV